ncbi:MAG: peptidase M1 [Saprospiraceae bacterium]|nr:peptidase M1 [Saprospiraceae bacterium]
MKWIFKFLVVMLVIEACTQSSTLPESGVSLELAQERKVVISNLEYDLSFDIPELRTDLISASAIIRFNYEGKSDLQLDFKDSPDHVEKLIINGTESPLDIRNEHIIILRKLLKSENVIELQFIAGNLSLNRNDEYLYTLLVPDRARTVFPVMDQPNLKATWNLTLTMPQEWEAVANGPVLETTIDGNRKIIKYKPTKPISSYLFAFAAGKFQKVTNTGGDMTMYYRDNDRLKVARNAPEIFDLHRQSLDWLEQYTGIKYPFEKFDFVLIPTFQYGGMEHPGNIFYRERSLLLDESASINQQLRRASLIAHETAHMWFGDLVTMNWFDDVWLKEVFANFMAAKIVNPSFPEINHDLRFLLAHYPTAYEIDRSEGTHPIQQPLDNLQNAGSLYGAIIYQKAPIVMRNLETIIGEEPFRAGLQEYLNTYAYSNATWDDLIEILEKHTDQDLNQWNHDWVKSSGMPEIRMINHNDTLEYAVTNVTPEKIWPQQIQISMESIKIDFLLKQRYTHPLISNQFFINQDGRAYGYFDLDDSTLDRMILSLSDRDEMGRATTWTMLWEAFLNDRIKVDSFYTELLAGTKEEFNPLILEYLTGRLQTVFWIFLNATSRSLFLQETESILYNGMLHTNDPSLQRSYYDAYSNIAMSEQAVNNLRKILNDQLPQFTLPIFENDKISLTLALLLRDVGDAPAIIETQLANIENPDNRKRFEFILPAVSMDSSKRDQFFQDLLKVENRNQEPWVSEALSYLHHPLMANQSVKYLRPSLEIIEEIKATGDIFFPKSWLDATLGGHCSPMAGKIVHGFLSDYPKLPSDLRNKILQSADLLFRSESMKH